MPRHDYDRPRKPAGGLLLGLLIGGGAVVLLGLVGCVGCVAYLGRSVERAEEKKQETARTLPTRDEFRAAWLGKTGDDLLAAFGKPSYTDENAGGVTTWTYGGLDGGHELARDPVTGRAVDTVWIDVDKGGRVVEIRFG